MNDIYLTNSSNTLFHKTLNFTVTRETLSLFQRCDLKQSDSFSLGTKKVNIIEKLLTKG